jgi:hypothetical protein
MVTNAPEQCQACKKRFCEPFGKYDAVRSLIAESWAEDDPDNGMAERLTRLNSRAARTQQD